MNIVVSVSLTFIRKFNLICVYFSSAICGSQSISPMIVDGKSQSEQLTHQIITMAQPYSQCDNQAIVPWCKISFSNASRWLVIRFQRLSVFQIVQVKKKMIYMSNLITISTVIHLGHTTTWVSGTGAVHVQLPTQMIRGQLTHNRARILQYTSNPNNSTITC